MPSTTRITPREPGRIYCDELGRMIHRKTETIRKWEKHPVHPLPKRLHPKRGTRGWRYWTEEQVYGRNGVIAWMRKHDLRPGKDVTDPSKEVEHINHLRKPKYLTGDQLRGIRDMVKAGKTRRQIVNRYFKRTRYATKAGLERALDAYFKSIDMTWPDDSVKTKKEIAAEKRKKRERERGVRIPKELRDLEKKADRLLRLSGSSS